MALPQRTEKAIVLYDYQTTQANKHPLRFLKGFKGYMHVDGYQGYNGLPDITLVGCWAHARRKFDEALKALPKDTQNADVAARKGLDFRNRFFSLEREFKKLTAEERYREKLKRSHPVIDEFNLARQEETPVIVELKQAVKKELNRLQSKKPIGKEDF